jgi:hypothetical protein
MGTAITNPAGAFGYANQVNRETSTFVASAAIPAKTVVRVLTDGRVVTAATNSTASLAVGVTLTSAAAAGDTVEVAVRGHVAGVPVDGATAAGAVLIRSETTAGRLAASASPAVGEALAVAIAASASGVTPVWIAKSL